MSVKITMPALSPTMEQGHITKWLVKEGDKINPGDIIAEIETDKATMEVESTNYGVLARILFPEGSQNIKVHTVIAILAEPKENYKDIQSLFPLEQIENEKNQEESLVNSLNSKTKKSRILSSPLARRIANQEGIDLDEIPATGPQGKIIKRDVEDFLKKNNKKFSFSTNKMDEHKKISNKLYLDDQILNFFDKEEYNIVPHTNIRDIISKRLLISKQNIPHFYVKFDCHLNNLLDLKDNINDIKTKNQNSSNFTKNKKISINDMLIKAIGLSLMEVPKINCCWLDQGVLYHEHANVSIAVNVPPNGLITPIIKWVNKKSLSTISEEAKKLIQRARQKKLDPSEYEGGSTTISNMGMFGIKEFSAIINPPQSTIFAVGMTQEIPTVKNNNISIAKIITITISADHRIIDGSLVSECSKSIQNLIENPLMLL